MRQNAKTQTLNTQKSTEETCGAAPMNCGPVMINEKKTTSMFSVPEAQGVQPRKPLQPIERREARVAPAAEPAPSTETALLDRPATRTNGAGNSAAASAANWGAAGDAIRFLQAFDPSGWHNMVAFDPHSGRPVDGRTFPPNAWRRMAGWLNDKLARDFNVYFSVNEPKPNSPSKKLSKTVISKIRALFGDVDPQGGAEELDAERTRIRGAMADLADGPNPPTYAVDSGGGFQAFWKIEPIDCNEANRDIAEGIGECLSKRLGGDAVMNVDRIMRLPGTDNVPDAKKVRKGRVRRRATLLFDTRAIYTLEQLAEEFPPPPESERVARGGARRSRGGSAREWTKYGDMIDMEAVRAANDYDELAEDLRMRFDAALARSPRLRALWEHGEKEGDRTGSGYVISLGFHLPISASRSWISPNWRGSGRTRQARPGVPSMAARARWRGCGRAWRKNAPCSMPRTAILTPA